MSVCENISKYSQTTKHTNKIRGQSCKYVPGASGLLKRASDTQELKLQIFVCGCWESNPGPCNHQRLTITLIYMPQIYF